MNTSDVVMAYLAARRAQGVQIRSGARALRQFARETGYLPLHEVTPQAVRRAQGRLDSAIRATGGLVPFRSGTWLSGDIASTGTQADVATAANTLCVLA